MLKNNKKKLIIVSLLSCIISVSIFSFTNKQQSPVKFKNLKVLPQDISDEDLDKVMDGFKAALGVKCGFCHAPSKENPKKSDMASDDNPRKDITREMMRMTQEMNMKYISKIPHADSVRLQMLTCNTCHRGATKPFGEPLVKPKQ